VKPGLTGLWQVLGRRVPSFEMSITLDMAYIEKWNLLLDFLILLQTIPAIFAGEGQ
jgi:lipopolysaccharide/colanic/teichoic acid biosynthesis glycosyltransferase